MNITKITPQFLVVAMLFSAVIAVAAPSPTQALTKAEQQACKTKWAGEYLASSQKVKNYRASDCAESKGGNCTSKPTEGKGDRLTITCKIEGDAGADPGSSTGNTIEGCGDIKTSIIKCNTQGGNPIISILLQIINFMAVGVGIAVVGGIIWGGMMYASSNGDSAKTKQAITIIVNAIVGLLLFIFMYAFINYIVPGGLFN